MVVIDRFVPAGYLHASDEGVSGIVAEGHVPSHGSTTISRHRRDLKEGDAPFSQ
jgi:hypothetical protein